MTSRNKTRLMGSLTAALIAVFLLAPRAMGQQNCPVPPAIQPALREQNIFSEQQEVDLGDVMAESLARRTRIIDDDKLTADLRALGDRLVQHLPPSQLKFRFYLIELPEVNAFSIAGGRVYVTRKMVALTKSDDELAGVLAHELGHIITHQTAIQITARLREILGVTEVGDRADIFEKFHLLLENEGRKPVRDGGDEEDKQYIADQVALYAMARAGYAPHAYVDLWDRFQQTHGKTGNWMSNLFGTTKPSERRLGVMLKNISALPAGCADIPPGSRTAEFARWQEDVIAYSGFGTRESLPGLVFKQTLARPLRPDITNLRFSQDGKYLLAQDEGGIHVLTRNPFSVLFYIEAIDARDAQFTPDSRSIVFHNRSMRVESWSVIDQRRVSVHELTLLHECLQSTLSPDGSTLGCLNSQFELSLVDVASGSVLTSKKSFTEVNALTSCTIAISLANGNDPRLIEMKFSPDGHYFAAGAYGSHFAWDVTARRELALPGSIKNIVKASFAFLGPDRIIGIDIVSPKKSPILQFPSGVRLQQIELGTGIELTSTSSGDYLLVGPLKDQPMGLYDLKSGRIPVKFKRMAADIYDGTFVNEKGSGELILNDISKFSDTSEPLASVKLPQARLAPLQAAAVSADFNWMAISHRTRGAVWDVTHNIRTMELRSFHGAWFAPDHLVYVDFPKMTETERGIGKLDPAAGNAGLGYKIGDAVASQYGPYLLVTKSDRGRSNGTLAFSPEFFCLQVVLQHFLNIRETGGYGEDVEIRDVRDGRVVWSHSFPHEAPSLSLGSGVVLLKWSLGNNAGREELGKYPELNRGTNDSDYLLEKIDLQKDNVVGKLVIKTNKGSFAVNRTFSLGDWVVASASGNQVLTYSLTSGLEKGHFFGANPLASQNGLLALENEAGQLDVYDMASSQLKQQYTFTDPISFKTFSPDGARLFVMTVSQTAYIFDLTAKN